MNISNECMGTAFSKTQPTPLDAALHTAHAHRDEAQRLIVRASAQGMRVAAIWQVLLPFSRHVEKVEITTSAQAGFEEACIALRRTPREALDHIVARFDAMPWVISTTLC